MRNYLILFGLLLIINNLSKCSGNNPYVEETPTINAAPLGEKSCGFRRIFGKGTPQEIRKHGEFPWMVSIYYEADNFADTKYYRCGGTLINPSVVLVTAVCIESLALKNITIRGGQWNPNGTYQDRIPSEILVHENYGKEEFRYTTNDIALIFLDKPFDLNENVNTICLPPQDTSFVNQICQIASRIEVRKDISKANIVETFDLTIIPLVTCQKTLSEHFEKEFKLNSSHLCAKAVDVKKDATTGDGGSPLSCAISGTKNQYYLAGLVGWGAEGLPSGNTNVAHFRKWIDEKLASRNISSSSYTF